ncbi:MAG: ammonium transporter [Trueperaceae bacterium]
MKKYLSTIRLFILALVSSGLAFAQDATEVPALDAGNTAWMLICTGLVLLMTPALAFFYGGLVRSKNALNTMMMSFIALGFVGITWALIGYTLSFTPGNPILGSLKHAFLNGVGLTPEGVIWEVTIPHVVWVAYQGTFCIITAALISGAIVERMRFAPYIAFITLWSIFVYAPLAHMVWGGGLLAGGGLFGDAFALDFAGGTVVHINAAVAALVAVLVLGKRKDYGKQAILPHNVPFVLLGAGLLWLGWFGFNAGSAWAADGIAGLALINTFFAPMATLVIWTLLDFGRTKKATAVGAATAIVVGLVAITPAAGFVSPMSGILIGAIAAFPSYFGILWRSRSGLDDSLDVFAAHGLGGITGALLTGVFASTEWNALGLDGLLAGNPGQLGVQAGAIAVAMVYSGILSFVLLKIIGAITPLRASDKEEGMGLDVSEHGEEAYTDGEGAVLIPVTSATAKTMTAKPVGSKA